MPDHIQLARQPILDVNLTLRGYELLARDVRGRVPGRVPGPAATCNVLVNALAEFGLERVVGTAPAFVNITREFVVGEMPLPLPPEKVVLEVLESVEPDEEVQRGLRRLRAGGFRIALDDYTGPRPGYDALFPLADYIKVDCFGRTVAEIAQIVHGLKGQRARLLAEKVETHQEFRAYRDLGFPLFQGFFFAQPMLLRGHATSASRVNLLHLLAELQDLDATPEKIENIISRDPALSLKLVRYLNSVHVGLRHRVEGLREVVVYLGTETVRNFACMILLSRVHDKPRQLMTTAMMRARMCEELAQRTNQGGPRRAFTVGLFSILDALTDRALDEVLADLPLAEEIGAALLHHQGVLGEQLKTVLAFEKADWMRIPEHAPELEQAYEAAAKWVADVERELAD
jgi:EAL and modified HD-GYP domain-containing signal transduction protein